MRPTRWGQVLMVVVWGGCGAEATPGIEGDVPETSRPDGTPDSASPDIPDIVADDDGTRYPIPTTSGVVDGTFETDVAAAFDGDLVSLATTSIYENLSQPPLLYKEFDCETRLRRLEVHPPSHGHLLYHATNFPQGTTGTATVVGRRADSTHWYNVASKPFVASGSVVFLPEELGQASQYVAYGVTFAKDEPLIADVQVAEVTFFGYCASPTHQIAWSTTDWLCTGVECVAASNVGGLEKRTVTCARDAGGTAHPDLCEGAAPPSEGESCSLECGYELVYVGPRAFTYSDGSGWLHEGRPGQRAGPLPSDVEFGQNVDAIAGKPCSVLTTNAAAYFVGISCVESQVEGEETLYCAFRCE